MELLLFFALSASADPKRLLEFNQVDGQSQKSDSGVKYPKYSELRAELEKLEAEEGSGAKLQVYGETVDGEALLALRIETTPNDEEGRQAVQISGAIHGNEYLGIELDLARAFVRDRESHEGLKAFLDAGGVIYVIPVVNPDGFTLRRRANQHGSDLNRDFDVPPIEDWRFLEPETNALSKYLADDLQAGHLSLEFSLDYHCCGPSLITPWSYVDRYPSQDEMVEFNAIADLQKEQLGFEVGNPAATVGYTAIGTSIDYFYSTYGTRAFAIEGRYGGEAKALEKHLKFYDGVFARLAEKRVEEKLFR